MTDFQICLCGAMPGYPHAVDCPRPSYNANDDATCDKWEADRAARRLRLAEHTQKLPAARLRDIAPGGLQ